MKHNIGKILQMDTGRGLLTGLMLCICMLMPLTAVAQGTISRKQQTTQKEAPKKQSSKPRHEPRQEIKEVKVESPAPVQVAPPEIPPFSEATGFANGHGYVDLGLPSGVKWAVTNIGAANPSQYGDFFAFGETCTKETYEKDNSKVRLQGYTSLREDGVFSRGNKLAQSHDPATVNWGLAWKMPSKSEWQELIDRCEWSWATHQGINGYKVTGPNGNQIFIQAAGMRNGNNNADIGTAGFYLSTDFGAKLSKDQNKVMSLDFNEKSNGPSLQPVELYYGYSIRPVLKADISRIPEEELNIVRSADSYEENSRRINEISGPDGYINGYGYVDLGLPSGLKWAVSNVSDSGSHSIEGNYYAWGDTQRSSSKNKKSKFKGKNIDYLKSKGIVDVKGSLLPSYDAASQQMGGTWRMPTKDELEELLENCEWTYVTYSGWEGCKVTGPNGRSIFIARTDGDGDVNPTFYWTATADNESAVSYVLSFISYYSLVRFIGRLESHVIRAVSE